jgi:hypothetical protein
MQLFVGMRDNGFLAWIMAKRGIFKGGQFGKQPKFSHGFIAGARGFGRHGRPPPGLVFQWLELDTNRGWVGAFFLLDDSFRKYRSESIFRTKRLLDWRKCRSIDPKRRLVVAPLSRAETFTSLYRSPTRVIVGVPSG